MPFVFNVAELCIVSINEKPWTPWICAGRWNIAGPPRSMMLQSTFAVEKITIKWQLTELVSETNFMDWPKDLRKDYYYTSEEGMYELLFSSQQPKAKDLKRHCCNVLLPYV